MAERSNKWGDVPNTFERQKRAKMRRINDRQQDRLLKAIKAMTAALEDLAIRVTYLENAVGVTDRGGAMKALKSPCATCDFAGADKLTFEPCVEYEARHEYANMITGEKAKPSDFRDPYQPSAIEVKEAAQKLVACRICGNELPEDAYRMTKRLPGRRGSNRV